MYCKKTMWLVILFFLFFYVLNYLTPLAFGDDYVYSFIWQGHSEYEPMIEPAVRVSSFEDLRASLLLHYFTWSGRTVSHFLTQYFLWLGKNVFNIFNSLVSVLLIMEIYWCANKGVVTFRFKSDRLCWIFFALWAFTPGFSPVFFWLSGACNYLWTAVLLLAFLLPYIHKYYFFQEKFSHNVWFVFAMFFSGTLAGWSNENSICWIIIALTVFIFVNRKSRAMELWMLTGLTGLVFGYALLMLAPGNVARLYAEVGKTSGWLNLQCVKINFDMLVIVITWQFLLWYFSLRSLMLLPKNTLTKYYGSLLEERRLVIVFCMVSFCMSCTMLLSPNFPPRSSFPGTVQLVIAASILLRIQYDYTTELMKKNAKRFLTIVGIIYITVSTVVSVYGFYDYHVQVENMLSSVRDSASTQQDIVTVHSLVPVSETIANLSGLHLLFFQMSEDENDWRNVAFARYYGLKAVRMVKHD